MKQKVFIISVIAIIISLFSLSYTFAANNVADGVRNAVGSAENVLEGAGNAVGKAVQSGVNTVGDGARNIGNATENTVAAVTNNNDNNGYTATRTATRAATTGVNDMGTSTTMFTWVIIGVTAVGIGVLLWSYFRQNNRNNLYIDSDDE